MADQPQKPINAALKDAVKKKRQTQEAERINEAKRATQTVSTIPAKTADPIPPPARPAPTTAAKPIGNAASPSPLRPAPRITAVDSDLPGKITTQVMESVGGVARWTPKQRLIAALVGLLVVFGCVLVAVLAGGQSASSTSAYATLPPSNASSVLSYLGSVGLVVSNVHILSVPNKTWNATQGYQVDVQDASTKGSALILSYNSGDQMGGDAFWASHNKSFEKWTVVQAANVLMLTSPDTPPALNAELASHLTRQLIAPYRTFLPTATPKG